MVSFFFFFLGKKKVLPYLHREMEIKARHYFIPATSPCPQIFASLKSLVIIGGEDPGKEHM